MNPNQDNNTNELSPDTNLPQATPETSQQNNVITPEPSIDNEPLRIEPEVNTGSSSAPVGSANETPVSLPVSPSPPPSSGPQVGYGSGAFGPTGSAMPPKPVNKMLVIILAAVFVLILGGSAYAYFGYYMSPSTIWSDSLSNASSGYNQLVSYANTQSEAHYHGLKSSGSFALTTGTNHYSGSEVIQSQGATSTASVKLDLGVGNIDLEERSIPVSMSNFPDIYFQLNGANSLNASSSSYGSILNKINGQWVLIDHNLIDDLESKAQSQSKSAPKLTWADIDSYLMTTESINKKYLFTANQATAVTKVLKSYGSAKVNGQNTDHYLVGFNKTNLGDYYYALCTSFSKSSIAAYLKQATGGSLYSSSDCQSAKNSAKDITSSDTFQVWDNVGTRLPYQVRVSDKTSPAENYVDIGLNYLGGKSYPFYLSGQSGNDLFTILATLNTNSNDLNLRVVLSTKSGSKDSFSGQFNIEPSNQSLKVSAPTGSIPLTTELNNFGLSLPTSLPTSTSSPSSSSTNPSTLTPFQQTLNQAELTPPSNYSATNVDPSQGILN